MTNGTELEESRRVLATLVSNLPGMVYRCANHPDWPVEVMSDGAQQVTGYPAESFTSGRIAYGDLIHPNDRDRIWGEVQAALAERRAFDLSYRIRSRDGEVRCVWERGTGVFSSDGELRFLEGFITDVTEREALTRELHDAQRRALEAERLASIGALTAGLAHDLGTPMTAILGYAELIAKSVPDEKNRKRAAVIVEQVQRVSELIDSLLQLAGSEAQDPVRVKLGGVVDQALGFYRDRLRRRGIQVERRYSASPTIRADPNRLQQALLSLLMDSIQAMPGGGVLRVSLSETDSGEAELRVRESGARTDAELGRRLVDASDGRGVGLAVARTVLGECDTAIDLVDDASEGTEFRILFAVDAP